MNRDNWHRADGRRFTFAALVASAATAALLLVPEPAAAQLWPEPPPPEPVQEGTPPPDWLAGACAGATPTDKCSAAEEAVPVGQLNFEGLGGWAARPGTYAGVYYGTSGSTRVRPLRKCDSLDLATLKARIWAVAESYFDRTGYTVDRAMGPQRIVAYGSDRQTRKRYLFADIDLRSFNPARLDGLGCNILSNIYEAWRQDGEVRVDTTGRALELRRALRQDLSS